MRPSWDILIASVEHRTDQLTSLLADLALQMVPGVGVRIYRDNQENAYGAKCQALLGSSSAEYTSFVDDDDHVAPGFEGAIVKALEAKPDQVGFRVRWTEDGVLQRPVIHSLHYEGWIDTPDCLYRDLQQFQPLRRELALMAEWEGGNGADRRWSDRLRALGVVKTEVFIDAEVYEYRHTSHDTFLSSSTREPLTVHPSRPELGPWLTYI